MELAFYQGNVGRLIADFLTVHSNNNYLVIYIYIHDFLVLFYLHQHFSKTDYCGWTMTMDFAMDQCLQSDARQSHSLGADWIVK